SERRDTAWLLAVFRVSLRLFRRGYLRFLFSFLLFHSRRSFFFFFIDTATTEIYTLSLHDALPIFMDTCFHPAVAVGIGHRHHRTDRKSTRLNSSHVSISYAVFCLKKKTKDVEIKYQQEKEIQNANATNARHAE